MKILPEISFTKLIYNPLVTNWKALVVFVFCGFLQVMAMIYPHIFTYRFGRNIFIFIVLLTFYFDYLSHLPLLPENIKVRFYSFFEKYFLLILLSAISLFSIGALNEKLFDNDPAKHSIYQGFTIGGIMPFSDNAGYLIDIQSFLKYGVIQSVGIYRPIASLVAAVLYKCCGEEIITYYYLTTVMLILAIFWLGRIIAYNFNKSMATIVAFCLSLYFALFLGSFLTEITGGIVGLLAFAALLESIFRKNVLFFFLGIVLLGFALQMRAGAMFILPILVFFGAVYFRKKYWVSAKTLLVSGALVVITTFTTAAQLSLFSQKIDVASNIGDLVYQIQVNSTGWRQVRLDYADRFKGLKTFEEAKLSNEIAWQKFKDDPFTFFAHYLSKMYHVFEIPEPYIFHFTKRIPRQAASFFLMLFFLTPVLYSRNSKMQLLFWFLCLGLVGSVLSSPLLWAVWERAYAASISFNVMIFAVSIANGFLFIKGFRITGSGLHWDFYYKPKILWFRFKDSIFKLWHRKEIVQTLHNSAFIYIAVALIIFIGPVITDKLRNYKVPQAAPMDSLSGQSEGLFLLSVQDSPHALIDPQNDFVVNDPLVIPRTKLMNNKQIDIWPDSRFFLFNTLNHFDFKMIREFTPYLVITESLLASVKLEDVSMIVLKGENVKVGYKKIFFSKEIVKIILKPKANFQ